MTDSIEALVFTESAALPLGLLVDDAVEEDEEGEEPLDADALAIDFDDPDGGFPVPVKEGTVPCPTAVILEPVVS